MPSTYTLFLVVEDAEFKKETTPYYHFTMASRQNENAGFDLLTAEDWAGSGAQLLDLGVRAMLVCNETKQPVHYWLLPRSSIYKTGYMMANSAGVIDASYRGVLKAPVVRVGGESAVGFKRGDRHFQIVAPDMGWISDIERVAALPETGRGAGGFGSTGA
jgi:deoxyuridine 5'-triphosphate nucleotidohydrolase